MKLSAFLKDKSLLLLLHVSCMGALMVFLRFTGYSKAGAALILVFWLLILCIWLSAAYFSRKKHFDEIEKILEQVDQRYLLGELLPPSFRLEDKLYRGYFRQSNKSVIERIRRMEQEQQEYREYIERWVHEIKAPITGIDAICENTGRAGMWEICAADAEAEGQLGHRGTEKEGDLGDSGTEVEEKLEHRGTEMKENLRAIRMENRRIENYVDMALYYARSGAVYKDYFIQETNLQETAEEVLSRNRLLLIQNHVSADVQCGHDVYTDRKWIGFILEQMILNSVKYCSKSPQLRMYTKEKQNGVVFMLEDNGDGIPPEELSRIFEKGFTGSNGRNHERATGMGLYLCKKLCGRLGVGLSAESAPGEGTRMLLVFPVSSYIIRELER